MKRGAVRNGRLILVWLIVIIFGFTAAPFVQGAQHTDVTNSTKVKEEAEPVLSDRLFDASQDQGLLTIRYFALQDEKKSGDSILIKSPEGKTLLVDAGRVSTGAQIDDYLQKLQLDKIDYTIVTHPHQDHIGGYQTLFKTREFGQLFMPDIPHKGTVYSSFFSALKQSGTPYQYVKSGDRLKLGNEIELEVLNPPATVKNEKEKLSTPQGNNRSLVFKLKYQNHTFLFTADIYTEQENHLVQTIGSQLQADFLDVPHHARRHLLLKP